MRSRRVAALGFTLAVALALLVAGCGPRPMEDGPPMPKPQVKVSNLVVGFEAPPEAPDLAVALTSAFTTAYPQFAVETAIGDAASTSAMAERSTADVLVLRAAASQALVSSGLATDPRPVFHTDYVLVGPGGDPARVKGSPTCAEAFARIARREQPYYSAGATSTAHAREMSVMASAAVETTGAAWYQAPGASAADVLRNAGAGAGYTLVDRATWLSESATVPSLTILLEGTEDLADRFVAVRVAKAKDPAGVAAFLDWMTGTNGQALIGAYGAGRLGGQVLFPDAAR